MDIRVLKYFLAVCNERNIVNASKSLNLTQPTLSRQLIELEKELLIKIWLMNHLYCQSNLQVTKQKLEKFLAHHIRLILSQHII